MLEEQSFEFRLFAMVKGMKRAIVGGNQARYTVVSYVNHSCSDAPFSHDWYRASCSYWKTVLGLSIVQVSEVLVLCFLVSSMLKFMRFVLLLEIDFIILVPL